MQLHINESNEILPHMDPKVVVTFEDLTSIVLFGTHLIFNSNARFVVGSDYSLGVAVGFPVSILRFHSMYL